MTFERAMFHKLMVEVGLYESFDSELNALLEEENPLSPLVLDLASCGSDYNKVVSVLIDYLRNVDERNIDFDAVFDFIWKDLQRYYLERKRTVKELTELMYSLAWNANKWRAEMELSPISLNAALLSLYGKCALTVCPIQLRSPLPQIN